MADTESGAGSVRPLPGEASGPVAGEVSGDVPDGAPESPAEERTARDTVYRLLATRARSRAELLRALRRKGVATDTAETVLDRFAAAGLVDDAAFAAEWVRGRHRQRGLGRGALREELRDKGIDEDTAAEALESVDTDAEVERARELVRRRARGMTAVDARTRTRRLLGLLARKGYGRALAFRVVREELESTGVQASAPDEELWFEPDD
ncbi:regulatory protein [Actinopolyspora xinjiangensis]|uniref:Regulatory protein RecX n=1 Tax=Actinopolyspora xinjiangensis TaxID=405564 RepID=A0A1H0TIA3_9ACTN|nr:regulatory protein RecX [Actinopolyspora xinjiangensis]SDP53410.1 regulatory protein [Actinopolyspora xinjiangensis]